MNEVCGPIFRQLEWIAGTVLEMAGCLTVKDLDYRPDPEKRSLGELLSHIVLICAAGARISDGATEKEMADFYLATELHSKADIATALRGNLESLRKRYGGYTPAELSDTTTAWWGISDTRLGWLVQILAHMAHHRGQLHSMMVRMGKDPGIQLFE